MLVVHVVRSFWVQDDSARIASPIPPPASALEPDTSAVIRGRALLFQRLILVAGRVVDSVQDIFRYEACAYPVALFDATGFLREANRPPLADAIWAVTRGD